MPSRSQAVNQSFTIGPVEIEIPSAARKHVAAGIKTKDPRTLLVAIQDATLNICQDDPGDVPVEQDAIALPPGDTIGHVSATSFWGKDETIEVCHWWLMMSTTGSSTASALMPSKSRNFPGKETNGEARGRG
jgi:hypothetical protein